ncbi:leucine-rich repeat domain-containing protein [Leptospira ilyithenensis]|uniref:Leucine-rich repeat domain-containing protein n=2 Tax=Leptospira ilyithenensis TaxID=2484901 RepID=A0A4R9LU11_9LEPT|nr:leucine-rich repeat domain-containing protein [Leptospira ilyithenensis]
MFILVCLMAVSDCKKETISFEDWIQENKTNKIINLSQKEIGSLPASIAKLEAVEELTLQYDSITAIPTELGSLTNIRILNLSGNSFSELPESSVNLQKLETLLLGRTDIAKIPGFLSQLKNLKTLALDETKISLTEEDIEILSQIPNLEILDITLCKKITKLPKNISKLSHLKELQMGKVQLEKSDVARLRDELPKVYVKL